MSLFLILLGVQGAGKGVQASFIKSAYNIPHVSTGDLFRAMKTRTDPLAQQIQQIMAEGKLISDEITNQVVAERLSQPDAANGVILDGYPRTTAQAEWLDSHLRGNGQAINAVVLMKIDLFEAFRRAFGRVTASNGDSYNVYSNAEGVKWEWVEDPQKQFPPRLAGTLTATGEKLLRRADDANAHAIIKRIDTFKSTTEPLIAYYQGQGVVCEVDATQPIEAVSADIKRVLDAKVKS